MDELKGKLLYEKRSQGWPTHIEWEDLLPGTQYLWIERATKEHHE